MLLASQCQAALRPESMAMKTQGEIEAAICDGVARFEQEYMGPFVSKAS